jgi:hypothetical protein
VLLNIPNLREKTSCGNPHRSHLFRDLQTENSSTQELKNSRMYDAELGVRLLVLLDS